MVDYNKKNNKIQRKRKSQAKDSCVTTHSEQLTIYFVVFYKILSIKKGTWYALKAYHFKEYCFNY